MKPSFRGFAKNKLENVPEPKIKVLTKRSYGSPRQWWIGGAPT